MRLFILRQSRQEALSVRKWDVVTKRNERSCDRLPLPLYTLIAGGTVIVLFFMDLLFFNRLGGLPVKKIKPFHLAIIASISVLLALWNPLEMDNDQRILLSSLVFTVALWATEAVHKSIACIFLLVSFSLFGKTPLINIVNFAWSDTILLIITTTWLSVGMMKTGLIHHYVEALFRKNSSSIWRLLLLPYLFGAVLVFFIPQAFARVIIIGVIFHSLLSAKNEEENKAKQVLIFNGFLGVTMSYMLFNNGDIVLNQAAIRFSGDEVREVLTFGRWFVLMALPSLLTAMVSLVLTFLLFKKELQGFTETMIVKGAYHNTELSKEKQYLSMAVMLVIIILWMTQSLHGISPWISALVGVFIMFGMKILDRGDLSSVNPHFLLFLIIVFSIGKVLGQSGITEVIFEHLKHWIPTGNSSLYLLLIAGVVMVLHICIGSSVATMSVVLPIIIPLTGSLGYRAEVVTLMTYVIVNIHFLLPFHHATVMIGTAREYYPENYMLRFGSVMTAVTFLLLGLVYFPWWKLMQVL